MNNEQESSTESVGLQSAPVQQASSPTLPDEGVTPRNAESVARSVPSGGITGHQGARSQYFHKGIATAEAGHVHRPHGNRIEAVQPILPVPVLAEPSQSPRNRTHSGEARESTTKFQTAFNHCHKQEYNADSRGGQESLPNGLGPCRLPNRCCGTGATFDT